MLSRGFSDVFKKNNKSPECSLSQKGGGVIQGDGSYLITIVLTTNYKIRVSLGSTQQMKKFISTLLFVGAGSIYQKTFDDFSAGSSRS